MTSEDEEEDSLLQPNAFTIITHSLSLSGLSTFSTLSFMSFLLKGGKKEEKLPLQCFFRNASQEGLQEMTI